MDRIVFWDPSKETAEERMKWNPSEHDLARLKRLANERGRFINCRHYRKQPEGLLFDCLKYGLNRKNCNGCNVCPNCDGRLTQYKTNRHNGKDSDYICIQKSCVNCGSFVEEEYSVASRKSKPEAKQRNEQYQKCQVSGCPNTAYEGHIHVEEVDGVGVKFVICETHRRRHKTWRLHPSKGLQHKPLLVVLGMLVDNPDYSKKQKRRSLP